MAVALSLPPRPPRRSTPPAPLRPRSPLGAPAHGELRPRGCGGDRRLRALRPRPPPVSLGRPRLPPPPGLRGPGRAGVWVPQDPPGRAQGLRVAGLGLERRVPALELPLGIPGWQEIKVILC
ncbi:proline-rich protein 2-like [Pseudopipra pipra]|uniref:proline-rich protein 2-like n=1 Tax=Pseudopipra pipra TaxID=415032 RepID=UPI003139A562